MSIERQEEGFGKLLECLTKRKRPGKFKYILARVGNKFSWKFIFKPEEVTFEAYSRMFESIFEKDCEKWPDEKKVRLGKFGVAEAEKYVNCILPKQPGEVTFRETIQIQTKIFEEESLLFNTRWQCLNLMKKDCEDYTTFACTVNRYCERFLLNEITPDMV